jgi:predicted hotdog family 3-hydroxylacyl-ACP dehydratase
MGEKMFTELELAHLDIESLIPHSEGMCLLEKVIECTPDSIICHTQTHLKNDNPLKTDGSLSNMHLIEYGAQAVAVHGGLIERLSSFESPPKLGYIALLKSVKWGGGNLKTACLEVKALLIMANDESKLYEFYLVDAEQQAVCSGRVMIVNPSEN